MSTASTMGTASADGHARSLLVTDDALAVERGTRRSSLRRAIDRRSNRGTGIHAPVRRLRRLARTAVTLGVIVAGLVGAAGAADAAVMVSINGIVGPTREAAVPVSCNNSGLGYYITVGGPAAWARALTNGEKSQYVQWGATLVDETTGATTYSGDSAWSVATTTTGVQFSNDGFKTHRGDTFIVVVGISWWSPSYRKVIGTESWVASSYYITDQGRYATSC